MYRACFVVLALMSCVHAGSAQEDEPKPPKDSTQLVVTGCLDKRVLDATRIEPDDTNIDVHDFHLSGKKNVMEEVKARNKQRVVVTGWVRKVDLMQPGLKVGGSRITIGPVTSSDPMRPQTPAQGRRMITMEAIKVEPYGGDCTK